jgi:hypothetical protein
MYGILKEKVNNTACRFTSHEAKKIPFLIKERGFLIG